VCAIVAHRLFRHPKELAVHPPGIDHPVRIRVRTTDPNIYRAVLLQSEYAFELPFLPNVIVDAGANIGMASIFFANKYPQTRIIAIEPEPSNFEILARNVSPYKMITPVHAALWNQDDVVSISNPDGSKWGFRIRKDGGPRVRALTVPTLMREMNLQSIDVLKVDIEGAEKEVFETAPWMQSVTCLMIEVHERLNPGCTGVVESAVHGFTKRERGETTVYLRKQHNGGTAGLGESSIKYGAALE